MPYSTAMQSDGPVVALLLDGLDGARLLNLGSGSGSVVRPGRLVVNVDHVPPAASGGVFVVADIASLPFRPAAFDGVLLKDVVEHVPDPIAVLAEAARVVQPGGRAAVEVPRAIPRAVWDDPTHVRGFTAHALTQAMELAGWVPAKPRRMGGFPGAGRLGLVPYLEQLMRVPGFGHWCGLNWLVRARRP
jgi:SAM-dependent methyltransferase